MKKVLYFKKAKKKKKKKKKKRVQNLYKRVQVNVSIISLKLLKHKHEMTPL